MLLIFNLQLIACNMMIDMKVWEIYDYIIKKCMSRYASIGKSCSQK